MGEVIWRLDALDTIGGHRPKMHGHPRAVDTDRGPAIAFDGEHDLIIVPVDPLAGAAAFTLEAVFRPDPAGAAEQRFVHLQANDTDDRALLETRLTPDGTAWYADTFLRSGDREQPLNDPSLTHPLGAWHTLTLTCDGQTMRQFVDGIEELTAPLPFIPRGPGRVALGGRINAVSHFRGVIHSVRFASTQGGSEARVFCGVR